MPGIGGVFNCVNGNLYHYAANNPVKYTDPDGKSATGAVLGWIGTDLSIPEPTDVIPWKWVGYGAAIAGAAIIDYFVVDAIADAIDKSKDKKDSEAKPADEPSVLPKDGTESGKKKKIKAKERREQEREKSRVEKHGCADWEEPASEQEAKWRAKQKEEHDGKDGRREAHDAKEKGAPDRSKRQLEDDYGY